MGSNISAGEYCPVDVDFLLAAKMEREPTGIPDLDRLIEGGIPRPFCLSVCGDIAASKHQVVWHMTAGLLRNGCFGLYVCLDSAAQEIRNCLRRIDLDADYYERNGILLFLDFFSARAEKIRTGEIPPFSSLTYDTNEIMKKTMSYLPKLKERSFIVIDTVSTLLMDINAREVYELIRGFKMLTRTHNTIGIGISHTNPVDLRELEMLRSNADGCIRFQDRQLWVERFDRTAFDDRRLELSRAKDAIVLRPMEKSAKNLVDLFKSDLSKMPAMIDASEVSAEYGVDHEEAEQSLQRLSEEGLITKGPNKRRLSCPKCSSLNTYQEGRCPHCGSPDFRRVPLIEHFSCGSVRPEQEYVDNLCPKCRKEIRLIGVDYKRSESQYVCVKCGDMFQDPVMEYVCAKCGELFHPSVARWMEIHSYLRNP